MYKSAPNQCSGQFTHEISYKTLDLSAHQPLPLPPRVNRWTRPLNAESCQELLFTEATIMDFKTMLVYIPIYYLTYTTYKHTFNVHNRLN